MKNRVNISRNAPNSERPPWNGRPVLMMADQKGRNMSILKFEDNKIYRTSTLCEKIDVFEIVDKIPVNFFVWNIGENMGTHEYIPVCEDLHQEDKENFEINTVTLKAVKVAPDEWEKLNKSASWGIGNLKQAEKALKSKRHGYTSDRKRAAAELTIEIFRRICE